MTTTSKTPADIIRDAFDTERVGTRLVAAIEELDTGRLREVADLLTDMADQTVVLGEAEAWNDNRLGILLPAEAVEMLVRKAVEFEEMMRS